MGLINARHPFQVVSLWGMTIAPSAVFSGVCGAELVREWACHGRARLKKSLYLNMNSWRDIQSAFKPDGTLRDIYISPATASLWDEFIALVRVSKYRIEFWHGESKAELPTTFEDIKHLQLSDPTTLKLFLPTGGQIHCYFFVVEEIEMDIDPKEVGNAESFEDLLNFLGWLSIGLKHSLRVTFENSPNDEIFAVHYTHA